MLIAELYYCNLGHIGNACYCTMKNILTDKFVRGTSRECISEESHIIVTPVDFLVGPLHGVRAESVRLGRQNAPIDHTKAHAIHCKNVVHVDIKCTGIVHVGLSEGQIIARMVRGVLKRVVKQVVFFARFRCVLRCIKPARGSLSRRVECFLSPHLLQR